tara:strand:+ start:3459 stop:4037 length:579 start_codon:yes stop_codon:yes gene_type:complete
MKNSDAAFQEYRAVLAKVEAFTTPLWRKFESEINCEPGCAQCCTAGLTLLPVEAAFIQASLQDGKAQVGSVERLSESHCSCLNAQGLCDVYAHRPLVCRTHGLPMKMTDSETSRRPGALRVLGEDTVTCSLNFDSGKIPQAADVLDVAKVYQLLWVVNARFCADQGIANPNERVPMAEIATGTPAGPPGEGG